MTGPDVRWRAADGALGHLVSRGVVVSAAAGEFAVIVHPGEIVWAALAEPRTLVEVVGALQAEGAPAADARTYAAALIEDLVRRRLLDVVPGTS